MDVFIEQELKIRRDYLDNEAVKHFDRGLHRKNLEYLEKYRTVGMDKLIEKGIYLVDPSLYFGMMKYGRENLKKMREAGILMGFGIDAGMPFAYFGSQYRELELLHRIGFSTLEILQVATINSAKILKREESLGSIDTGKCADMVILKKNPLKDVTAYREPMMVIKDGRPVHSSREIKMQKNVLSA